MLSSLEMCSPPVAQNKPQVGSPYLSPVGPLSVSQPCLTVGRTSYIKDTALWGLLESSEIKALPCGAWGLQFKLVLLIVILCPVPECNLSHFW